jgi:hypothetical protein
MVRAVAIAPEPIAGRGGYRQLIDAIIALADAIR